MKIHIRRGINISYLLFKLLFSIFASPMAPSPWILSDKSEMNYFAILPSASLASLARISFSLASLADNWESFSDNLK
jgi:hypothetical protein